VDVVGRKRPWLQFGTLKAKQTRKHTNSWQTGEKQPQVGSRRDSEVPGTSPHLDKSRHRQDKVWTDKNGVPRANLIRL
jgi:hypothetical protein